MNAELPIIWEKHDPAGNSSGNSRNGISSTTVKGDFGELEIEVPREDHRLSEERSGGSDFEAGFTARQSDAPSGSSMAAHGRTPPPSVPVSAVLPIGRRPLPGTAAFDGFFAARNSPHHPFRLFPLPRVLLPYQHAFHPPVDLLRSLGGEPPPSWFPAELHLRQAHTFGIHSDDHSPAVSRPFSGSCFGLYWRPIRLYSKPIRLSGSSRIGTILDAQPYTHQC
jgi:hypothetical protein